jgi:hypothetical protein
MVESSPGSENQTTRVLIKPNDFKYNRSERAAEERCAHFSLFPSHPIER